MGWSVDIHIQHTMVCKITSNRSGISSRTLTQALRGPFSLWMRPSKKPSFWRFSVGQLTESWREDWPAYRSISTDSQPQIQLCQHHIALWPHVLSQDTWYLLSKDGQISRQGITPCFWKRVATRLGDETCRTHRRLLRRPCEKPHLCKPVVCNVSPIQVNDFLGCSTQSMGRSWGITIVATPSYYATALSPLTSLQNVMGEAPPYPYPMLWISKRATLTRLITTRFMMGSPTCP